MASSGMAAQLGGRGTGLVQRPGMGGSGNFPGYPDYGPWFWSMIRDGLERHVLAGEDVARLLPEMEQSWSTGRSRRPRRRGGCSASSMEIATAKSRRAGTG